MHVPCLIRIILKKLLTRQNNFPVDVTVPPLYFSNPAPLYTFHGSVLQDQFFTGTYHPRLCSQPNTFMSRPRLFSPNIPQKYVRFSKNGCGWHSMLTPSFSSFHGNGVVMYKQSAVLHRLHPCR